MFLWAIYPRYNLKVENLRMKKKRFVEWNSWSMADKTAVNIGEWAFFHNYLPRLCTNTAFNNLLCLWEIKCNKMGKVEGKDGFRVTKNTKVCHAHFNNEDVLKVPGGSRWKLREDAKPIKDNFWTPRMKRKPPLFRCKELKPKRLRFGEKNECSSVCLHQPKSLLRLVRW